MMFTEPLLTVGTVLVVIYAAPFLGKTLGVSGYDVVIVSDDACYELTLRIRSHFEFG
jgi:hypothetical protein